MNIQPINIVKNNSITYAEKQKHPSFKGLWGNDKRWFSDGGGFTIDNIEEQYYPFVDETSSQIQKILESRKNGYWERPGGWDYPEDGNWISINAVVAKVLPFTKEEWTKYSSSKFSLDSITREYIETTLKRFNLKHLIK